MGPLGCIGSSADIDLPDLEVPDLDVSYLDVPDLDVSDLDVPDLDVSDFEVSQIEVSQIEVAARSTAHAGVRRGRATRSAVRLPRRHGRHPAMERSGPLDLVR